MAPAVRLEMLKTADSHRDLALETSEFLEQDNVDTSIFAYPDGEHTLVISPEPKDSSKPVSQLTSLAKALLRDGCVLNFHTGHYLSDIGVFNAMPKPELNAETTLSMPWSELADDGPLEALTLHEIRHFHQHRERTKARDNDSESGVRPDVRVKFSEEARPNNWLGKQPAYNGLAGHSIDEVDAYLYQSKLHLKRATRKAKIEPSLGREDARRAVQCAAKAGLFAMSDSQAMLMDNPDTAPVEAPWNQYIGDTFLSKDGVSLFVDSGDFQDSGLLQGLQDLSKELRADGEEAKNTAGQALLLLSKDPGAVEEINEAIAQIQAVGWLPEKKSSSQVPEQ